MMMVYRLEWSVSVCSDVLLVEWRLSNNLLEKHMHVCCCRTQYCAYRVDTLVQDVSSWIDRMERKIRILTTHTT